MALVRSAPKSEPVFGSVKTAVGKTSPLAKPGSHCFFCSSVPPHRINSAAISVLVPSEPTPIYPLDNSSETTAIDALLKPSPPYSSGIVNPKTPNSDNSEITSRGMSSSFKCHSWAYGSILSIENFLNCSLIISKSSSKPLSPTVTLAECSNILSTRSVRASWVLPLLISSCTTSV